MFFNTGKIYPRQVLTRPTRIDAISVLPEFAILPISARCPLTSGGASPPQSHGTLHRSAHPNHQQTALRPNGFGAAIGSTGRK
jgi:hypothetical protein